MAASVQIPAASGGVLVARKSHLTRQRIRSAWLFLTPMLLVLVACAAWPLIRTIFFAFTDAQIDSLDDYNFIGFANFLEYVDYGGGDGEWLGLLVDPTWWRAVWNTIFFSVISVSLEVILGFAVALILNSVFPGRGLMRTAILVPWAIPTIVSARMWDWMLNDQFGVINDILLNLHLISSPIAWTASSDTAMIAVILVDVWKTTPFMALLILAGLQTLPGDIYEAAKVDGIHPVRVFFKITLPLVRPALMVAVVFRALDALRIFDLIYVLTPGKESTISMSIFAREQLFDFDKFAYGSAASTMLFLIIGLITIMTIYLGRMKLAD